MNSSGQRIAEVERYIHELAIALSGLPADEREDVISGIREHIDDALLAIAVPTPDDVRRILDDLGDPLAIAADAGAPSATRSTTSGNSSSQHASGSPPAPGTAETVPLLQRDWIPAATVIAFAVAGVFFWAGGPGVWLLAAAAWLAGLVTLLASPLWSGYENLIGTAVFGGGPVLAAGAGTLMLGWRHRPSMLGAWLPGLDWWRFGPLDRLVALFLVAIPLVIAVGTAIWLLRRGSARARR